MKTIGVCLIGVIVLAFGLWPQSQQDDPKAEIKRKHRDARYTRPGYSITNMNDGGVEQSWVNYIDTSGYDPKASTAEKEAVRNRLAVERTAARKAVACGSTVILFGKIKEPRGYVTTDDTAIYTVYKFVVNDIYRAPRALGLRAGSEIEVTAPGGFVKHKSGRQVGVQHPSYSWLAPNTDHILYLKYDQEADDYYVFDPIGIYKVMPEGRILRGDSKDEQLARQAHLAREPNGFDAITAEIKSITCPQ